MGRNGCCISLLLVSLLMLGCSKSQSDVIHVNDDDPVMTRAIEDARESVEEFVAVLQQPRPGVQGVSVKVKFEDGESAEHMWLSSVTYSDGQFSGVVDNEPESVSTVKYGDRVQVAKEEISDWMFLREGKLVGGYTIRALMELTPEDQRPSLPFEL